MIQDELQTHSAQVQTGSVRVVAVAGEGVLSGILSKELIGIAINRTITCFYPVFSGID
ncbi:hypothetical protein BN1049_00019 [Pseudomonas saudimassiliensis]|uniref:Uncharacterized protein n=2 Tax=Pseudomonas saudimassiliensis TaxID=1461581 RepID=A0A078M228_9PSED|nr:hypothetical protein BN1049_00019 [Pseudomonas saudimassiliensis]CEF25118.1 hypothetical protein BN1049_00019 [Pseudomonas saudimassiliensis]